MRRLLVTSKARLIVVDAFHDHTPLMMPASMRQQVCRYGILTCSSLVCDQQFEEVRFKLATQKRHWVAACAAMTKERGKYIHLGAWTSVHDQLMFNTPIMPVVYTVEPMKCSSFKMILLMLVSLVSSQTAVAQNPQSDLSVSVTSEAFSDGIEPGESGLLQFHVTNHGPDPITNPDASLAVMPGFNVTQDDWIYTLLLESPLSENHCSFEWRHIDPRPPINDIMYVQSFIMHGPLAVNQTKTCTLSLTFEESGQLETIWWVPYGPPWDPDESNNYFSFEFRGQTPAVPLNINLTLLMLIGFAGLWTLFRKNNPVTAQPE